MEEVAIQPQRTGMRFRLTFVPVQLTRLKSGIRLRVRDVIPDVRIGVRSEVPELFPPTLGHELTEFRVVVSEVKKWSRCGPLLTHEQERRLRCSEQQRRHRPERGPVHL